MSFPEFPFFVSTQLYPSSMLIASKNLSIEEKTRISEILLSVQPGSKPALNGNYTNWTPLANYLSITKLQTKIGVISDIKTNGTCIVEKSIYDSIRCPDGYHIVGDPQNSCSFQDYSCPHNWTCICQPCQKIKKNKLLIILISVLVPFFFIVTFYSLIYSLFFKKTHIIQEVVIKDYNDIANSLFTNIKILNTIGCGSYGKVFYATWNDLEIALKITKLFQNCTDEATLAVDFDHENIIKTYDHQTYICQDDNDKNSVIKELWILQEYCSLGNLSKSFIKDDFLWNNYNFVLLTLIDIACGLQYISDKQLIHGDINCNNILLQSKQSTNFDKRHFYAKIADFGMITYSNNSHISKIACGTITHMAPELILYGHQSMQCDIYSFGIIMWELYYQKNAYNDNNRVSIVNHVIMENKRPEFANNCDPQYKSLTQKCWNKEKNLRPSWKNIIDSLNEILSSYPTK